MPKIWPKGTILTFKCGDKWSKVIITGYNNEWKYIDSNYLKIFPIELEVYGWDGEVEDQLEQTRYPNKLGKLLYE